jgi:glycosyltransferase involved in cell wall biosynthesis
VHIHALFSFSSTLAAWIARLYGVPYVVRPLGTLNGWGVGNRRARLKRLSIALIERRNLRAAAAVHFTSAQEMEEAKSLGLSFRGVVIPLGVEAQETGDESCAGPPPPALAGRRVILFLSRLSPKKNLEALIDALAHSPGLRESAVLLVAGEGEAGYVERLRARARAAGVADAICWLGHVDGAAKARALRDADLFVLPSFSENFGIAAAEALQAGVPCVLAPGVAVAAAAARAGAAVVVEPEAAALADALERLLQDGEARRRMSARAREFARDTWSTSTMAARLVDLYETVATRRRSSGE